MGLDTLSNQCFAYGDVAGLSSTEGGWSWLGRYPSNTNAPDVLRTVVGSESPKSINSDISTASSPPQRLTNTARLGERQKLQASLQSEVDYLKSFNRQLEEERECLNNYVYQLRVMLFDMKHSPYSDYSPHSF
ncbi:hypothetical protein E3P99_03729 [Wallemia hederae]|uniref:Uncharacterized protein n=1 Tax=Wallemia hederae TaxID=1540922 RepID=A0A4T0FE08_9BASI|nr:hypothetical protein E3P99_03729 [Wallemia hederae]